MLSIQEKIDRAQRLVRLLEDDAPLLDIRLAALAPERRQATKDFASKLTASARAELSRLMQQMPLWDAKDSTPQPAD